MLQYLGPDPLDDELNALLARVAAGEAPSTLESCRVDFKEEAGRRGPGGVIGDPQRENPAAAAALVGEVCCMANTPGAGALVVGVSDDGTFIGTELDAEWLRHELYTRTDRQLTVDVRAASYDGARLLILRVPEALEPIVHRGRITWRVDDHCVEVDPATWWLGRLGRLGYDWSAQSSTLSATAARSPALERARQFLRNSGDPKALALAQASEEDLLRRLNAVDTDGMLTNAGALLFVGTGSGAIDYIRRDVSGGDSTMRLRSDGQGLLEELWDVEQAIAAANPTVHRHAGLAAGQFNVLPPLAVREAIVNAVVHRDWSTSTEPTTVEHIGSALTVSSPGGFVGGVSPENIITHPSAPRYRALTQMAADLRVAEREGIGVDRMVREMLRPGYPPPVIEELPGPRVRAALVGGQVDEVWLGLLGSLDPPDVGSDLDALLVLRHLSLTGWVDAARAAPVLQRSELEADAVLVRLAGAATSSGAPVIVTVAGVPPGDAPAWRLGDEVRDLFSDRMSSVLGPVPRSVLATGWARARGRISTTELADLVGIATNAVAVVLSTLEADGVLGPSRENRSGRGFHYLPLP